MNYLAHAYLSFEDKDILAGNMISDFVKGRKKFDLPPGIQQGITLHRAIDEYTDQHPVNKRAKDVFRPVYRLYSGAFVDIVYDHFLALDQAEFNEARLLSFSQDTYKLLEMNQKWFPAPFAGMFPHMKQHNWLYHYRDPLGIERSFEGLARRSRYLTDSRTAFELLEKHYQVLETCYQEFFPQLKSFAHRQFQAGKDLP